MAFGSEVVAPSTLLNFEVDTLYLDWGYWISPFPPPTSPDRGWIELGNLEFWPEDLSEDVLKVRNLAIYNGTEEYPIAQPLHLWFAQILVRFGNV